jgi:mevalonate kinase
VDSLLEDLLPENPIRVALEGVKSIIGIDYLPACTLKVTSTIPIASGLGSGAAVSVAIIRAMGAFLGKQLSDKLVSSTAFQVEKIHHGTPSGIDNTVVTYAQPVFFIKGKEVEVFETTRPFTLLIGNTGIPALTKESVGDVRSAWQADPKTYERLFAAAGSIAKTARQAMESGHPEWLGALMDENHELLQDMGVSSAKLDGLVMAAKNAGALGAKLSGGGRGGNMIALVKSEQVETVTAVLEGAGAIQVIRTRIKK